jgi:hypothetical protein
VRGHHILVIRSSLLPFSADLCTILLHENDEEMKTMITRLLATTALVVAIKERTNFIVSRHLKLFSAIEAIVVGMAN